MPVYALGADEPAIDGSAWVHPEAVLIGRVTVGPAASVWPSAVLRGDFGAIAIGTRTSVQDGTVIHAGPDYPTVVGAECVIGHNVHLEGCTIEDDCLIGSAATVLPHAVVGQSAVVAAGALIIPGTDVPPRALAIGVPAEIRPDAVEERRYAEGVQRYVDMARRYASELREVQ